MKIDASSLMSLLTPSKASDAAREDRLKAAAEAKLREARAAAETLKERRSESSEQRKAAALQKIEQLKARLQMLRSMASIDPEGTARLAAGLARELGSAVKAYAAAGGGTSGMAGGAAPAVPAAPAGPPASGAEAGADAAAQGAQPAEPAQADAAEGDAATDDGPKEAEAGKSANPYQQAIDEQNARAAETARHSGEAQADAEVMADVRKMAAEIKALVRQAIERAKRGEDDGLPPGEAAELEKAVAAMSSEVAQASADLSGGGVSLLV